MSQGLMVYLVPERALKSFPGSRNESLLNNVLETMADDIANLDDEFETFDEDGPGLSFAQALRELCDGRLTQPDECDFVYTYAFETLCRYLGEWMSNRHFCPSNQLWFDRLDQILTEGEIKLRFRDLLYRCPIADMSLGRVLGVGHWKRIEIQRIAPVLVRFVPRVQNQDEREALQEATEWLMRARENPGSILVGVFC